MYRIKKHLIIWLLRCGSLCQIMFNGININEKFNNLQATSIYGSQKLSNLNQQTSNYSASSSIEDESSISKMAYEKFVKENDINNFAKMVLNSENTYFDNLKCMSLFENCDFSNDSNSVIDKIYNNDKFIKDVLS